MDDDIQPWTDMRQMPHSVKTHAAAQQGTRTITPQPHIATR